MEVKERSKEGLTVLKTMASNSAIRVRSNLSGSANGSLMTEREDELRHVGKAFDLTRQSRWKDCYSPNDKDQCGRISTQANHIS